MSDKYCHYCCKADHSDSECWSTRAAGSQVRPFAMPIDFLREPAGMQKLTLPQLCRHREHYMPTHLFIPGGHKYVHYCPGCQHKSVAFGVEVDC